MLVEYLREGSSFETELYYFMWFILCRTTTASHAQADSSPCEEAVFRHTTALRDPAGMLGASTTIPSVSEVNYRTIQGPVLL